MIEKKQRLLRYLFFTGILGNLAIVGSIFFIRLYLNEPASYFLERLSNHLTYSTEGEKQKIGSLLLKTGLVDDWKSTSVKLSSALLPISNWQGQGASENVNYSIQEFNGLIPKPSQSGKSISESGKRTVNVFTSSELISAIQKALPGDIIQLAAGTYLLNSQNITAIQPGDNNAPITVRSDVLGNVKLKFNLLEGFHINAPYWVFENLDIQGVCPDDSNCEHAFHVVGNGRSFVLRNNRIYDFNAPLKVNGAEVSGMLRWPDYGLVENNTVYNTRPRNTNNPVNLLNINGVNNWIVRSNLIADFSKANGDHTSFGAYMKGNGANGIFERNLVICEMNVPADQGVRIGLSFGGGGTGKQFCRNQDCTTEHTKGIMRNNIILNCSHDVGIYLNRSAFTAIYNNLIFNSLGIDIRFETSTAVIANNIISGRIKERDGGAAVAENNLIDIDCLSNNGNFNNCSLIDWFNDIKRIDLNLLKGDNLLTKAIANSELKDDFCGNPVDPSQIDIGPIQYSNAKTCNPSTIHMNGKN